MGANACKGSLYSETVLGGVKVREANQMVEEMMLLANCTVADHILSHFPACALLRKHAIPPPRQFEPLLRAATACGIDLDTSTSKARTKLLQQPYLDNIHAILNATAVQQALIHSCCL